MDEEVTITATLAMWLEVLVDLDWAAQELDESGRDLEPGSECFIEMLREKGVTL